MTIFCCWYFRFVKWGKNASDEWKQISELIQGVDCSHSWINVLHDRAKLFRANWPYFGILDICTRIRLGTHVHHCNWEINNHKCHRMLLLWRNCSLQMVNNYFWFILNWTRNRVSKQMQITYTRSFRGKTREMKRFTGKEGRWRGIFDLVLYAYSSKFYDFFFCLLFCFSLPPTPPFIALYFRLVLSSFNIINFFRHVLFLFSNFRRV